MKFMNKKLAVLALACAFFCGSAVVSEAAGPRGNYGSQLTPEQMDQARKIFTDNYASMEGTRQALGAKRAELNRELASPSPDTSKIERLSTEIGQLRGKMLSARSQVRSQLEQQGLPGDYYGPDAQPGNDGPYWPMMGGYGPMMMDGYGPMMGWDGPGRGYHGHRPHHGGWARGGCGGPCWW